MDICETRQTLHRERDDNAINRFYNSHPFIHERCQIFNDHHNDWYNEYIHTHLPHAADIRAIIYLSLSISRETYIDPPNYPFQKNHYVDFEEDLREILDTWWDEFIYSETDSK